ncbi:AI-2E family transporter [Methanorbis furvi]|uniref:AI-2E family transporter n=1 Tax=Methanorbis furvi TaxID=3028299 RepID=A0AAE4MA16_9EURY|nr:hypothetical protein [Methanocorpusculaceae archaeon Ag1]
MNIGVFARDHFSLIVIAAIFLLTLILARDYLFIAVFSLSIAVVCMPLHRWLSKKVPDWISAGFIATGITAGVVGVGIGAIIVLLSDLEYLVFMLKTIIDKIFLILGHAGGSHDVGGFVDALTSMITAAFPKVVLGFAEFVPALIIDVILFFALLYCFIVLGDRIWDDLWSVLPETSKGNMGLMATKTKDILYALYIVHVFLAVLTFFLAYGFFLMLGYGHEMFYAMLCAVFALIPFLGPIMVLIFVGLYSLAIGDWRGVILICTIGYFLLCVVTDIILRPRLTGRKVEIRPMLMFVGFFGGAMVMGLLGFVLGPVLLVLTMAGYEIFIKEARKGKQVQSEVTDSVSE